MTRICYPVTFLFFLHIDDKKVIIDEQFIGELKGLKLNLDLKVGALDTDIKALKKAARQNIGPEFKKRINQSLGQIPGQFTASQNDKFYVLSSTASEIRDLDWFNHNVNKDEKVENETISKIKVH